MSYLKDLVKSQKAIEKEQEKNRSKPEYGIFIWDGRGRYNKQDAIKVYSSEKLAEKYADKLNTDKPVYVVRPIYI